MRDRDRGLGIEALRPTEGLANLLGRLCRCRMRCNRNVPDASPIVGEKH
jgi:hypothetical protein